MKMTSCAIFKENGNMIITCQYKHCTNDYNYVSVFTWQELAVPLLRTMCVWLVIIVAGLCGWGVFGIICQHTIIAIWLVRFSYDALLGFVRVADILIWWRIGLLVIIRHMYDDLWCVTLFSRYRIWTNFQTIIILHQYAPLYYPDRTSILSMIS
jgi:hypothetical protein